MQLLPGPLIQVRNNPQHGEGGISERWEKRLSLPLEIEIVRNCLNDYKAATPGAGNTLHLGKANIKSLVWITWVENATQKEKKRQAHTYHLVCFIDGEGNELQKWTDVIKQITKQKNQSLKSAAFGIQVSVDLPFQSWGKFSLSLHSILNSKKTEEKLI